MISVEPQGAVDVVRPNGPLNHENAEQLAETIRSGLSSGQPMVVMDMTDVPLVDSAGLEALLEIQQHLRESAGVLKIASLTQLCEDVFRVTGLAKRFETYQDVNSAVRSFVK